MKFAGKIKNGTLKLEDSYGFKDYLFTLEGEVEVEVKPSEIRHSSQQNSYYRVIVRILGKEIGYNEEEMHKTLKEKFDIGSSPTCVDHMIKKIDRRDMILNQRDEIEFVKVDFQIIRS